VGMSLSDHAVVSKYSYPNAIYVNNPASFEVVGSIDKSSGAYDFYVGVTYIDGPAVSISSPCGSLAVNQTCYTKSPNRSVGTQWTHSGYYTFPRDGSYIMQFEAGYISGANLVSTYSIPIQISVNVSNQPPPSPSPQPSTGCSPLVRTGNSVLDQVLFCIGGVGVTVSVVAVFFGFLMLLLLVRRRRR